MRKDLNLRMLDLAKFHIGVTEVGGNNRGPMVERFQKAVDGKASREAWCMAFQQYLAKLTVEAHGGKCLAYASEHCLTVWNKTPVGARITLPEPGVWVIWKHGDGPSGHVGIVESVHLDHILTVEGNTGPGSGIIREGDGVYLKKRPWNSETKSGSVGDMHLVGFLKVF